MAEHSTYVQVIGPGGFFASCCTCGSDPFSDRRTLDEAEADARGHGELRHLYPREQLVAHEEQAAGPGTEGPHKPEVQERP